MQTAESPPPKEYNGFIIKSTLDKSKLYAYNFEKDIYLEPVYSSFKSLKNVIDKLK